MPGTVGADPRAGSPGQGRGLHRTPFQGSRLPRTLAPESPPETPYQQVAARPASRLRVPLDGPVFGADFVRTRPSVWLGLA
jgi:hypothetical protein